jgi:transketolase
MESFEPSTPADLAALARRVRHRILSLSAGGGCFLGASLSCADLLVYLYGRFLRFEHPADLRRDLFLLSKGHDVPAQYATLVELGFLDAARLQNHLKTNDVIYWHPNRDVAGVEFHSGSLGHLLSVAVGLALDIRLRGGAQRVVVLVGDGELNEGSVWEALLVAAARRLSNLLVVVDRNGFQANARTEDIVPLEPLLEKFRSFGLAAKTVNGHDFQDLDRVFGSLPAGSDRPSVVVARTVRGKGIPSLEGRADRWFCRFGEREIEALRKELDGGEGAVIESEALVVR